MKRILMNLAVMMLAVFALTACATGTEEVGTATAAAAIATGNAASTSAAATALVAQSTADAANVTLAETADAASTVVAAAVADAQATADAAASALPATDVSATDVPATDVPATDVPATDVPATDVPATDVPATDVPATDVPATNVPATKVPATKVATSDAPSTLTPRQIRATARAESAAANAVPTEEVAPTEEAAADPGTLVDVAVANPEFSTLVALVQAAGLVDVLSNPDATFTVFAPTNDAFAAIPAEVLAVLGADPALLTRVLTYHVLGEIKSSAELVEMASATTMEMEAVGADMTGSSVTFTVVDDVLMVDAAKVIIADVVASNGVIHAIDAVLIPAEIAAMLAAPVEEPTAAPTQAVEASTGITSVCLVTDLGRTNDGTFNQYAYEGMVRAAEDLTLDNKFIETQAQTDYEVNIATCVDEGFGAIVTVGFLIADATAAAAAANPGVYFIGVDQFHANPLPNLVGIQFREDQAGFLVGALAAQLSVSGKIAGVYGIDIPPVRKFRNGFEQGAKYINPDIEIAGVYIPDFVAPQLGAEAAEQFVADGFDVVFGAGGPTGSGGIVRAAELGAMVIGVDQDEWITTFGSGETPGADKIISSALKRVDQGVYDMIAILAAGGALPDSSLYLMDAAVNGVGFAPAHDATISEEITAKVQEVFTLLASGELSTGVDPVTGDLLPTE